MRDAYPGRGTPDPPARAATTCTLCGRTTVTSIEGLFHNPATGSPRRFCSPACRQAAYRRRQAGAPETTPPQRHGGRNRTLTNQDQPT